MTEQERDPTTAPSPIPVPPDADKPAKHVSAIWLVASVLAGVSLFLVDIRGGDESRPVVEAAALYVAGAIGLVVTGTGVIAFAAAWRDK